MKGNRGLSAEMFQALESGLLSPVLERVLNDGTLDLEIRDDYINLYYRGGNLSKISRDPKGEFRLDFDDNYFEGIAAKKPNVPPKLLTEQDVGNWLSVVPELKQGMDFWIAANPRDEKEVQQRIVRVNNRGKVATGTDYFICDFEYQSPKGRFDLIGVRWPSKGHLRKRNRDLILSFIEVKYADGALRGKSGIVQHLADIQTFIGIPDNLTGLAAEMKTVFNQKRHLSLIDNQKDIEEFGLDKVELMFVLANHDPESKILKDELDNLQSTAQVEVTVATANLMGYGLYLDGIFPLEVFKAKYPDRIYCKEGGKDA